MDLYFTWTNWRWPWSIRRHRRIGFCQCWLLLEVSQ